MKLALDAGHSMFTAGKRCLKSIDPNETREWWLNNRICNYIAEYLKGFNVEILRLDDTTGNTDIPLTTRTGKANKWGADFTLSIHHNAGASGTNAGGITIHVYTYAKEPILTYQRALYDTLIKHTGLKGNRASPISKDNFHMLREITGYRSILIEHGFMDSKIDVPIILSDAHARNCAKAHAEWIVKTFNLMGGNMNVNSKVKIKSTAQKYMTGQTIPDTVKNKEYTISQLGRPYGVSGDGALIKEIVSWVFLSDLEPSVPSNPCTQCTQKDAEITALKKEIAGYMKELDAKDKTISERNNSISLINATNSSLQGQVNTLSNQLAKDKIELTLLRDKHNMLNDVYSNMKSHVADLEEQLQIMTVSLTDKDLEHQEDIDLLKYDHLKQIEQLNNEHKQKLSEVLYNSDYTLSDILSMLFHKLAKVFKE